jgi:hypothetical protein
MKKSESPPASAKKPRRRGGNRKHRTRPMPRWLKAQAAENEVAKRRCLLILSVLSGEKPVTDAIAETGLSRGTYYKLEERALRAMLDALNPSAGPEWTEASRLTAAVGRVAELEAKVAELEKDKRRSERLVLLTRKLVRSGPLVTGRGRPRGRKAASSSTSNGDSSSPRSTVKTGAATPTASTPTPAGASGS